MRINGSVRIAVGIAAALAAAACGSSSEDTNSASSTKLSPPPTDLAISPPLETTPESVPTSAVDSATVPPATIPTSPIGQQIVGSRCGGGLVELFTIDDDYQPTPAVSIDLNQILNGWTDISYTCTERAAFSADFTTLLVTAIPPAGTTSHVIAVETSSGNFVDLTEPRQGDGFSDEVLDEEYGMFLGAYDNGVVSFGSDEVLIQPRYERTELRIPISDPTTVSMVYPYVRGSSKDEAIPGAEAFFLFFWDPNVRNNGATLSPNGRFVASEERFGPASNPYQANDACFVDKFLGWVAGNAYVGTVREDNVQVVTISEDGSAATCGPNVIPDSDRSISDHVLSADRQTLHFRAVGADGEEFFAVPVAGGEPMVAPYPSLPTDMDFFFPVTL